MRIDKQPWSWTWSERSVFVTTSDVSFPHVFLSCLDLDCVGTLSVARWGCVSAVKSYCQLWTICREIWSFSITSKLPKYLENISLFGKCHCDCVLCSRTIFGQKQFCKACSRLLWYADKCMYFVQLVFFVCFSKS